jgi:hypothetical protein
MVLALLAAAAVVNAADVSLPEAFKGVVPLYPGATIAASVVMDGGGQVHLECGAKVREIMEFYRKAMKKRGWSEGAVVDIPEGATAAFIKEGLSLGVTALTHGDGKTHVTLCLARG